MAVCYPIQHRNLVHSYGINRRVAFYTVPAIILSIIIRYCAISVGVEGVSRDPGPPSIWLLVFSRHNFSNGFKAFFVKNELSLICTLLSDQHSEVFWDPSGGNSRQPTLQWWPVQSFQIRGACLQIGNNRTQVSRYNWHILSFPTRRGVIKPKSWDLGETRL